MVRRPCTSACLGCGHDRPPNCIPLNFAVEEKMAADSEGGASIVRRNRPGTKAKDMYNWPDQDFGDMETVLAGKSIR